MSLKWLNHRDTRKLQWLVLSLMIFILLIWLLPPHYASNDDMNLVFLTNGGLSYPTSYLVYTNVILGSIIKHLFAFIPSLNWFTLFSLVVYFIAFYGLTITNQKKHSIYTLILFEICTYFVVIHTYNYTTTSIAIAVFAGLTIISMIHGKAISKPWLLIDCLCLVFSCWLRLDSFLFACLLLLPWWIKVLIKVIKEKSHQLIILGCSTLLVCGISVFIDHTIANQSQYDAYHQTEAILHTINDYEYIKDYSSEYAENAQFYVNAGISVNTFDLLRHYTYADPDFFTVDRLQQVADHINQTAFQLVDFPHKLLTYMSNPLHLVWLGIVVLTISILWLNHKRSQLFSLDLSSILLCIIILLVYIHLNRLPDRVGMALPLLCLCYLFTATTSQSLPFHFHYVVYGLIILYGFTQYSPVSQVTQKTWISDIKTIQSDPNHIYLYDGFSPLMSQTYDFNFLTMDITSINNTYRLGGWLYQLPANEDILVSHGITNPFLALLNDPTVVLASSDNGANRILIYLQEHYDPTATVQLIQTYDNFNIYAFTSGNAS